MQNRFFTLTTLMAWACLTATLANAENTAPIEQTLTVENNLLSLHTIDTPFDQLLQSISQQANFTLFLQGDLSKRLSASFTRYPIDKAIIQLAGKNAVIITYLKQENESPMKLDEVRVYSNSDAKLDLTQTADLDSIPKLKMADNLLMLNDNEAIPYLTRSLTTASIPISERLSAAELLGEIGNFAAIESLALGLGDANPRIQSKAIEVLGKIKNLRSSLALAQITFGDPDTKLRLQALRALAQHEASDVMIFVRQAMLQDRDEKIRTEASFILQQLSQAH